MSERYLKKSEVVALTGLSQSTIWRMERKGGFPLRRRLSDGRVGWMESEIRVWLDSPSTWGATKAVAYAARERDLPLCVQAELEFARMVKELLGPSVAMRLVTEPTKAETAMRVSTVANIEAAGSSAASECEQ